MRSSSVVIAVAAAFFAACGGGVDVDTQSTNAAPAARDAPKATPAACLGHTVSWGTVGGWDFERMHSRISGCNAYVQTDGARRGQESMRCASDLGLHHAGALVDLERLLDDAKVKATFARGGSLGHLASPSDGIDDVVVVDGNQLTIGREAPEPFARIVEILLTFDERECPPEKWPDAR